MTIVVESASAGSTPSLDRDHEDWTPGVMGERVRHAAQEHLGETTPSAPANDDHDGVFVVGNLFENLERGAGRDARPYGHARVAEWTSPLTELVGHFLHHLCFPRRRLLGQHGRGNHRDQWVDGEDCDNFRIEQRRVASTPVERGPRAD